MEALVIQNIAISGLLMASHGLLVAITDRHESNFRFPSLTPAHRDFSCVGSQAPCLRSPPRLGDSPGYNVKPMFG